MNKNTLRPAWPIHLLVVGIVITLLASQFVLAGAAAQTDTPIPSPTEPPTPLPTETPIPLATETPVPAPTATLAPEPTSTVAPEPTETPPPEPTQAAVISDGLECTSFEGILVGSSWQFDSTCVYTINSARSQTQINAHITAAEPSGWTVQLAEAGGTQAWSAPGTATLTNASATEAGTSFTFAVRLTAPETAASGQSATVAISSTTVQSEGKTVSGPSQELSAQLPEPDISVAQVVDQPAASLLQCTEPNGDRVVAGGTITYTCTYSATYEPLGSSGALSVTYPQTTIEATIGAGWDVGLTSGLAGSSQLNGDGTASLLAAGAASVTFDITVTVKAPDDATAGDTGGLTLVATIPTDCVEGEGFVITCRATEITGTSQILSTIGNPACSDLSGTPVTASLVGGTLPSVPFSFEPRVVSAQLELQISNPQQCIGWVIDISATGLAYTGSAPGQRNLPASNLQVMGPDSSALPLSNTAQRLVSHGGGNATHTFEVQLVIPGGASAGTYTSTVTIITTAAPA